MRLQYLRRYLKIRKHRSLKNLEHFKNYTDKYETARQLKLIKLPAAHSSQNVLSYTVACLAPSIAYRNSSGIRSVTSICFWCENASIDDQSLVIKLYRWLCRRSGTVSLVPVLPGVHKSLSSMFRRIYECVHFWQWQYHPLSTRV